MSTLASTLVPRARASAAASRVALAVAGSLLVAALAQLRIPLPFTPVPITGQTLGVLLVGAALGPGLGAASMGLYLLEGAIGLPFFAGGAHGWSVLGLASATGGYLWGFVAAAAVVGWLARRGWDRSFRGAVAAMLIGEVVLYAVGVPWLAAALGVPAERALELGLYPFVLGDVLKLFAAAVLLPSAWRLVGEERGSGSR
ncbi:MAG TPA: biotin transporter BioY [Actinomycetota bacterium]|nr:biotin transporter BioY [Actinomycetota bacterium]